MVLLAGWLPVSILAQTTAMIPDTDAAQHVGQRSRLKGWLSPSLTVVKETLSLILAGKYPHQTFTVCIPNDSELAGGSTLAGLEGKKVKISGTIELYKGKPEIKIMSNDQLALE